MNFLVLTSTSSAIQLKVVDLENEAFSWGEPRTALGRSDAPMQFSQPLDYLQLAVKGWLWNWPGGSVRARPILPEKGCSARLVGEDSPQTMGLETDPDMCYL